MGQAVDVALDFVHRINARQVDRLCELMTEDHVFTDSLGLTERGVKNMRRGWEQYYRVVPDYAITVEKSFCDGSTVILIGRCAGTCARGGELRPQDRWEIPAAWRAEVRDGRIAEWQVFADNTPVMAILDKAY